MTKATPTAVSHQTRTVLLETGTRLFWENSIHSVSVDAICKAANVKKGSFYHFFESKTELVLEVFERLEADMKPIIDEIFSKEKPPLQRLADYAAFTCSIQREKKELTGKVLGCALTSCGAEMSTQDEAIRRKIEYLFDMKAQRLEEIIRDAIVRGEAESDNPAATAQDMIAYTMGLMSRAKIHNDLGPLERDLLPGLMHHLHQPSFQKKAHS